MANGELFDEDSVPDLVDLFEGEGGREVEPDEPGSEEESDGSGDLDSFEDREASLEDAARREEGRGRHGFRSLLD